MSILNQFASLPHRGATTKEERRAAEILRQNLASMNISAEFETFKATTSYSWEVILFSLTMIAGLLVSPALSKLGTALVLLGFWSYVRHFMGRSTIFTPFIPKKKSQNVVAHISAKRSDAKNIVLMAHYDSARASAVFAPSMVKNFRQSFLLNTYIGAVSIIWAYLGEYWGMTLWFKLICLAFSIVHVINAIIHIHREIFHKFVPGINDNASGVAAILGVLENLQKQPLKNSNVWIVFTGCEEAGIQGAKAFYHKHWPDVPPENTSIINIDNVGQGNLYYATGEGMILYYNFDKDIINLSEQLTQKAEFRQIRPLEYRRAYFDTLIFAQHGYPCTTLIALDDNGTIPNWHWYTDTLENIDPRAIDKTVSFATSLAREIDQKIS